MHSRDAFVALAISLALPVAAHAGTLRGTVSLRVPAAKPEAGEIRSPDARALQRSVTDAVVYVDRIPDALERRLAGAGRGFLFWRRPPRLPRMVERGLEFRPRVTVVVADGQLEVLNLDRVYHNVFSVSSARRFDLGKRAPACVDTVRFPSPGVVNLHCEFHPDELGFVLVAPNHAFARPDSLGRYRLPKLPEGRYLVRVWHPWDGETRREVAMPRHWDVRLDLGY